MTQSSCLYLATAADTNEKKVTLDLTEDSVDSEHMVKNVVEKHQGNIQFFLVENFEPSFRVFS